MATALTFPGVNLTLTAPPSMTAEQCHDLPVYTDGQQCLSRWQFSPEELAALNANGGKFYLGVLQCPPAPVYFSVASCFNTTLTPDYAESLRFIANLLPMPGTEGQGLRDGAELVAEQPDLMHVNGEAFEAGKQYYVTGADVPSYHYQQMVAAFVEFGQPGVVEYLKPYAAFLPKETITQPSQQ